MTRVAIAGFLHETNTFVPGLTQWEDFARDGAWPGAVYGDDIFTRLASLNLGIAGFMEEATKRNVELVSLVWAMAQPSGVVARSVFDHIAETIIKGLKENTVDAVYIELHGAMVSEDHADAEAELLRQIRAVVGPTVPILGTLDLHANVSEPLGLIPDLLISYRTYPHTDWGLSGQRAAIWLDRVLEWKGKGGRAYRQAPFLVPVTTGCTYTEPSGSLYRLIDKIEAETGAALSLNMGFPPADIPEVGPSVLAYAATQAQADAAADQLMQALLAAESGFAAHSPLPVEEAVAKAIMLAEKAQKPIVLADTQDNPGAGSPSNTTGLIKALLDQKVTQALVGIVHDEKAAAAAHAAGLGGAVASLGGGLDGPGQEPLEGPWIVAALSDGRFNGTAPMLRNKESKMGLTALLKKDGVEVLVASIRQQPIHRETFSHIGRDPAKVKILGLKSSAHFRAGFQEIAETVIVCLAPGDNPEDPALLPYQNIRAGVRRRPQA